MNPLIRYWSLVKNHWANLWLRLSGHTDLDANALAFQPDSDELEKQPVPLSTRLTYIILLLLVVTALIWSFLARMDMLALPGPPG